MKYVLKLTLDAQLFGVFHLQVIVRMQLMRTVLYIPMQADKLVSKSTFPDTASNSEWARYLYYTGMYHCVFLIDEKTLTPARQPTSYGQYILFNSLFTKGIIKAKQLDYSEAHKNLIQAIRKAPQFSAVGFRQIVRIIARNMLVYL